MTVTDRQREVKAIYVAPELTVKCMEVEGTFAASINPVMEQGPEWKTDDDWEKYDGDIWMPV